MHIHHSPCKSPVSGNTSTTAKRPTDDYSGVGVHADSQPKKARYSEDDDTPTFEFPRKVKSGTQGFSTYNANDVLCGRGGGTNQHYGNIMFRNLIDAYREQYLRSKKNDKPFISRTIVKAIRDRKGRFLKRDEASGLYFEIGDDDAREKASQALRQRAPERKRQLEEKDQMLSSTGHSIHSTMAIPNPIITPKNGLTAASSSPNQLTQYLFECAIWLEIVALRREKAQLQKEISLAKQGRSSGNYASLFNASSA